LAAFAWRPFLEAFSAEMLADPTLAQELPADVRRSGWLGFEGATEAQILAAEARIGRSLPPSYRDFLATSNGWRNVGGLIDRAWSTDKIEWFKVRNQEWIDAYTGPAAAALVGADDGVYGADQDPASFNAMHLETALEISDTGDSAILLLNPMVVTPDGEWEAWFFANWLPGANRYRSFPELMEGERRRLRELREVDDQPRPRPPGLLQVLWQEIRAAWRASR
jgi:hypothetical protein